MSAGIPNQLSLVAVEFSGAHELSGGEMLVRHFLDFHLNGRSLRNLIPGTHDLVTPLCREWVGTSISQFVQGMLGRAPSDEPGLEPNEFPLFVCAACGDIACGAVSAQIDLLPDRALWRDFRWVGAGEAEPEDAIAMPAIEFELSGYEQAFAGALEQIAQMPHAPPHRMRRHRRPRWLRHPRHLDR